MSVEHLEGELRECANDGRSFCLLFFWFTRTSDYVKTSNASKFKFADAKLYRTLPHEPYKPCGRRRFVPGMMCVMSMSATTKYVLGMYKVSLETMLRTRSLLVGLGAKSPKSAIPEPGRTRNAIDNGNDIHLERSIAHSCGNHVETMWKPMFGLGHSTNGCGTTSARAACSTAHSKGLLWIEKLHACSCTSPGI